MAVKVELCSESPSLGTSPRISFSKDLESNEKNPFRLDSVPLDGDSDFEFTVCDSISGQEFSCSADELFSQGKILPTCQIAEKINASRQGLDDKPPNPTSLPPLPSARDQCLKKENLKDVTVPESEEKTQQVKSFWGFKRSSSMHCENGYKRSLSICALPILSRSKSTGSVSNPKRSQKQPLISMKSSTSTNTSNSSFHSYALSHKSVPKKTHGGNYGNVLNIPPPYISKGTVNLFGFGSFFRNVKDKNSKK
ncbi:hypothetical protein RJ641_014874 [Dillenia turbinata]|uniref:Uncharacterized protein n=1 Tax=Dillenia turbinata TaxID=194707 RepID=A0AAN8Z1L0_9MAGN